MVSSKLFWIIFVETLVRNATSFNPLLTYTLRFHKMIFKPNITGHYTIDQYREKQFINAIISINTKESVDKVIVVFNRCNMEGVNCEYFQSWAMTDICPKLKDKHQIWSRWYSSYVPPMECPINYNTDYKVVNGSIDIGIALALYSECTDYSWKVTQQLYAGDKYVGSYTIEASLFGYRKRMKSRN